MNETQFIEELKKNNIEINETQLKLFKEYYHLLIEYNKKMNLTSITDKEEVYLKHFYDSLTLLLYNPLEKNSNLCDVGAGAGFPSIPIKIVRPDLRITIVDSLGKRIKFLNELIKKLKLSNVEAIHSRAEDYANLHKEEFDYVTARAVARLNILSELCIPLVKVNGKFIALKGQSGEIELNEAMNAIKRLGCKIENHKNFTLPYEAGDRTIIICKKMAKTLDKYPRNYSQIKNKPL